MRNRSFPFWKGIIFRPGKEIKRLRGGVHRYAAQANAKIDTARAEKNSFRTEAIYLSQSVSCGKAKIPPKILIDKIKPICFSADAIVRNCLK